MTIDELIIGKWYFYPGYEGYYFKFKGKGRDKYDGINADYTAKKSSFITNKDGYISNSCFWKECILLETPTGIEEIDNELNINLESQLFF